MSGRLVVFLDTSFLSDLAKARLGRLKEAAARRAEQALDFFTSLVDSRVAIFPHSWTREHEIELLRGDSELERAAHEIASRLSRGVSFQPSLEILSSQIHRLFLAHLEGTDYSPIWTEAFSYDPRGAIADPAGHGRTMTSRDSRDRRRERKRLFVEYPKGRARERYGVPLTYAQLKPQNARGYLEIIALRPARRSFMGERLDFADIMAAGAVGRAIGEAKERGDRLGVTFWQFANSDAILKVPVVDIWASLVTSIELDESSRRWKGSDDYDLDMLSEVLPYCDAVFCDRNMKTILRRRRIASGYGTAVYSMRDFEQFRRDAEAGPIGPLHAMDCRVAPIEERWQRVTDYLVAAARAVGPSRWNDPSPYPGWTYKDLLAHLATGYGVRLTRLRSLPEKGRFGPEPDANAANAESIARHRGSSPEALVEEMVRQRSEVRRLLALLRPEHLEVRTATQRRGQAPREGPFVDALQHWHEHDLEHAAELAPIMRWPVAPPEV